MRKRATFSPVLLELIVVILFFALSMSVVIRLIAAANEASRTSALESGAMLAMESAAEEIKADPAGAGAFEGDVCRLTREAPDGVTLSITVTRTATGAGALYDIEITAEAEGKPLGRLSAARYVGGEVDA